MIRIGLKDEMEVLAKKNGLVIIVQSAGLSIQMTTSTWF